jgi:hypothetical protein
MEEKLRKATKRMLGQIKKAKKPNRRSDVLAAIKAEATAIAYSASEICFWLPTYATPLRR